jgi:hypothetical protein
MATAQDRQLSEYSQSYDSRIGGTGILNYLQTRFSFLLESLRISVTVVSKALALKVRLLSIKCTSERFSLVDCRGPNCPPSSFLHPRTQRDWSAIKRFGRLAGLLKIGRPTLSPFTSISRGLYTAERPPPCGSVAPRVNIPRQSRGLLGCEPLKAASRVADAARRLGATLTVAD